MRQGTVKKRDIEEDLVYKSKLVARLINTIMHDGKKAVAQTLVYEAFDLLKEKNENPLEVFEKALENVSPRMEVRPRRVGGASYQVPLEVGAKRRTILGLRWILEAARKRPNREYHRFSQKLAQELLDAAQNQGEAIRKRDMTHRMAEANRAFAHFRW